MQEAEGSSEPSNIVPWEINPQNSCHHIAYETISTNPWELVER